MDTVGRPVGFSMTDDLALVRFFRGRMIIGSAPADPDLHIIQIADQAGIEIPSNCTSGNCGTCLVRLIHGEVEIPEELPPGLDEELISEGGILTCCLSPKGSCDIDLISPL